MFNKTDDQNDNDQANLITNNDIAPDESIAMVTNNTDSDNTDQLLDIKQQALLELSPLVDHLDQAPEEKFRIIMMMIQASDNKNLIREAFSIAKNISDDKVRAEALLNIVNEINYFTQKNID